MAEAKYSREQMLAKIQKLLAVAEDPSANEHIAAQAASKAQQFMQEWAIAEAELAAVGGETPAKFKVGETLSLRRQLERWEDQLAYYVGKGFFVHPVHSSTKVKMYFAGRELDVDTALYTYDQLRNRLDTMAKAAFQAHAAEMKSRYNKSVYNVRDCRSLSSCHPTVYRSRWTQSWLLGAVQTVGQALQAQSQKFEASSSTALTVVETKSAEAKQFANDHFNGLTKRAAKALTIFNEAHERGKEEGRKVEIRKGLENGPAPKQLT